MKVRVPIVISLLTDEQYIQFLLLLSRLPEDTREKFLQETAAVSAAYDVTRNVPKSSTMRKFISQFRDVFVKNTKPMTPEDAGFYYVTGKDEIIFILEEIGEDDIKVKEHTLAEVFDQINPDNYRFDEAYEKLLFSPADEHETIIKEYDRREA